MIDARQTTTVEVVIDLANINEAERRIQALEKRKSSLEQSGSMDAGQAVAASSRRTRAHDAETAAIDRQNRALNANAVARVRVANTGMMHGPFGRPATGMHGPFGPAVNRMHGPGLPPMNYGVARRPAPQDFGDWRNNGYLFGERTGSRYGYDYLYGGRAPTSLQRGPDGRRYMQSGGVGYLPGGPNDPRGPLSMNRGGLSPSTMAWMQRQPRFSPWSGRGGMSALTDFSLAAAGYGEATDPNQTPFNRGAWSVAAGIHTVSGVAHLDTMSGGRLGHYGSQAVRGGVRGITAAGGRMMAARGLLGAGVRATGVGTSAYLVLKPLQLAAIGHYNRRSALEQAIGANYDRHFAVRERFATAKVDAIRSLGRSHREQNWALREAFRDRQRNAYAGLMQQGFARDAMIDATYGDDVERVGQYQQREAALLSQNNTQRMKISNAQYFLDRARTKEDKVAAEKSLRNAQDQMSVIVGRQREVKALRADTALAYRSDLSNVDELIREMEAQGPMLRRGEREHLAKLRDDRSSLRQSLFDMGYKPDQSIDSMRRDAEAIQRNLINEEHQAIQKSQALSDKIEFGEASKLLLEKQVEAAKNLKETMENLDLTLQNNGPSRDQKKPTAEQEQGEQAALEWSRHHGRH